MLGDVICREAEQVKANEVLVGSRGLSAPGRFLLGSVSTAVVHNCPCTVVVVRGEEA